MLRPRLLQPMRPCITLRPRLRYRDSLSLPALFPAGRSGATGASCTAPPLALIRSAMRPQLSTSGRVVNLRLITGIAPLFARGQATSFGAAAISAGAFPSRATIVLQSEPAVRTRTARQTASAASISSTPPITAIAIGARQPGAGAESPAPAAAPRDGRERGHQDRAQPDRAGLEQRGAHRDARHGRAPGW